MSDNYANDTVRQAMVEISLIRGRGMEVFKHL